ncbi:hypothetical protein CYMTET_28472, partial [Cymbomonas tetramitiformis]
MADEPPNNASATVVDSALPKQKETSQAARFKNNIMFGESNAHSKLLKDLMKLRDRLLSLNCAAYAEYLWAIFPRLTGESRPSFEDPDLARRRHAFALSLDPDNLPQRYVKTPVAPAAVFGGALRAESSSAAEQDDFYGQLVDMYKRGTFSDRTAKVVRTRLKAQDGWSPPRSPSEEGPGVKFLPLPTGNPSEPFVLFKARRSRSSRSEADTASKPSLTPRPPGLLEVEPEEAEAAGAEPSPAPDGNVEVLLQQLQLCRMFGAWRHLATVAKQERLAGSAIFAMQADSGGARSGRTSQSSKAGAPQAARHGSGRPTEYGAGEGAFAAAEARQGGGGGKKGKGRKARKEAGKGMKVERTGKDAVKVVKVEKKEKLEKPTVAPKFVKNSKSSKGGKRKGIDEAIYLTEAASPAAVPPRGLTEPDADPQESEACAVSPTAASLPNSAAFPEPCIVRPEDNVPAKRMRGSGAAEALTTRPDAAASSVAAPSPALRAPPGGGSPQFNPSEYQPHLQALADPVAPALRSKGPAASPAAEAHLADTRAAGEQEEKRGGTVMTSSKDEEPGVAPPAAGGSKLNEEAPASAAPPEAGTTAPASSARALQLKTSMIGFEGAAEEPAAPFKPSIPAKTSPSPPPSLPLVRPPARSLSTDSAPECRAQHCSLPALPVPSPSQVASLPSAAASTMGAPSAAVPPPSSSPPSTLPQVPSPLSAPPPTAPARLAAASSLEVPLPPIATPSLATAPSPVPPASSPSAALPPIAPPPPSHLPTAGTRAIAECCRPSTHRTLASLHLPTAGTRASLNVAALPPIAPSPPSTSPTAGCRASLNVAALPPIAPSPPSTSPPPDADMLPAADVSSAAVSQAAIQARPPPAIKPDVTTPPFAAPPPIAGVPPVSSPPPFATTPTARTDPHLPSSLSPTAPLSPSLPTVNSRLPPSIPVCAPTAEEEMEPTSSKTPSTNQHQAEPPSFALSVDPEANLTQSNGQGRWLGEVGPNAQPTLLAAQCRDASELAAAPKGEEEEEEVVVEVEAPATDIPTDMAEPADREPAAAGSSDAAEHSPIGGEEEIKSTTSRARPSPAQRGPSLQIPAASKDVPPSPDAPAPPLAVAKAVPTPQGIPPPASAAVLPVASVPIANQSSPATPPPQSAEGPLAALGPTIHHPPAASSSTAPAPVMPTTRLADSELKTPLLVPFDRSPAGASVAVRALTGQETAPAADVGTVDEVSDAAASPLVPLLRMLSSKPHAHPQHTHYPRPRSPGASSPRQHRHVLSFPGALAQSTPAPPVAEGPGPTWAVDGRAIPKEGPLPAVILGSTPRSQAEISPPTPAPAPAPAPEAAPAPAPEAAPAPAPGAAPAPAPGAAPAPAPEAAPAPAPEAAPAPAPEAAPAFRLTVPPPIRLSPARALSPVLEANPRRGPLDHSARQEMPPVLLPPTSSPPQSPKSPPGSPTRTPPSRLPPLAAPVDSDGRQSPTSSPRALAAASNTQPGLKCRTTPAPYNFTSTPNPSTGTIPASRAAGGESVSMFAMQGRAYVAPKVLSERAPRSPSPQKDPHPTTVQAEPLPSTPVLSHDPAPGRREPQLHAPAAKTFKRKKLCVEGKNACPALGMKKENDAEEAPPPAMALPETRVAETALFSSPEQQAKAADPELPVPWLYWHTPQELFASA